MTRSIFDPEGGQTEHSGSRNLGPTADNISHMPPDVVDGVVSDDEVAEQQAAGASEDVLENLRRLKQRLTPPPTATNSNGD